MFAEFIDEFIFIDNTLVRQADNRTHIEADKAVYEVFRVISGYSLFIEKHINRLEQSLKKSNIPDLKRTKKDLKSLVKILCEKNNKYFGNIELRIVLSKAQTVHWQMGFIPHYYPEAIHYLQGINVEYIHAERENPNVKAKYSNTRKKANEHLQKSHQYEVLLCNEQGELTEGSRSNLFFIAGNMVYTAPDNMVLCGITRLKVLELLKKYEVPVVFESIKAKKLNNFDAAFICGTSPGILPIATIFENKFDVGNPLLRKIVLHYNDIINQHINQED